MKRPRFRLRTALLLVLLVALGLWAEGLRQRAAFCLAVASTYEQRASSWRISMELAERSEPGYDHPGEAAFYGRLYRHYAGRARIYRRSAYRPWVPMPEEPRMIEGAFNDVPRWHGPWR